MLRAQQQQLRSTPLGEGFHPTFGQIQSPPGLSLRTHPTSGSPTTPVVTTANDWLSASLTYIRLSQVLPRFLSRAVSPVVRSSFSFPAQRFICRHAPIARPRLSSERVLPAFIVFVSPSRAENCAHQRPIAIIAGWDLQIGGCPAVTARRDNDRKKTSNARHYDIPRDSKLLDEGRTMSVRIVVSVTELTNMDAKDRYVVEGIALSTATEDVGDGPQGHDNDTDPYSLSHLDPPTGSVYMIGGVLIAMVLVGVLIVLLAVTISKLRKRDDHHSSAVHPETTVVQTATSLATIGAPATHPDGCCTQMSTTTISTDLGNSVCDEHVFAATTVTPSANPVDPFAWQFPPPYPPPHMPPAQYALYNDQDTLVHGLPSDRPGFAKGFRKNLGGRWRRLVKRKAETDTCAIPPELKDQLKTIYVY